MWPASLSKVVYVGAWAHGTCEFWTGLRGPQINSLQGGVKEQSSQAAELGVCACTPREVALASSFIFLRKARLFPQGCFKVTR